MLLTGMGDDGASGLRVGIDVEERRLDLRLHGECGYNIKETYRRAPRLSHDVWNVTRLAPSLLSYPDQNTP